MPVGEFQVVGIAVVDLPGGGHDLHAFDGLADVAIGAARVHPDGSADGGGDTGDLRQPIESKPCGFRDQPHQAVARADGDDVALDGHL